jgi:hypothetical protein
LASQQARPPARAKGTSRPLNENELAQGSDLEDQEPSSTSRARSRSGLSFVAPIREDGKLIERTHDWYAQDKEGTVWYFGEDTKEYKNGKVVSTKGSWEDGVDGAKLGLVERKYYAPGVGQVYGGGLELGDVKHSEAQVREAAARPRAASELLSSS